MTLATMQQLRSFTEGEHPLNLEPGQIAFNMSSGNFDASKQDYNMYMYVGDATNTRVDEGGTVLVTGGLAGKGWVRYRMRTVSVLGDNIYGDINVLGAKLKVESDGSNNAELVLPKETETPTNGTEAGSVRWNADSSILQAWNGNKWDTTSKVAVNATAPANPSAGDLWLDPGPPAVLYVFVIPASGPAEWVAATSGGAGAGLQPGNGVSANAFNQIELINIGSY